MADRSPFPNAPLASFDPSGGAQAGPFSPYLQPGSAQQMAPTPQFDPRGNISPFAGITSVAASFLQGVTQGRQRQFAAKQQTELNQYNRAVQLAQFAAQNPDLNDAGMAAIQQSLMALTGKSVLSAMDDSQDGGYRGSQYSQGRKKGGKKGQQDEGIGGHIKGIISNIAQGLTGGKMPDELEGLNPAAVQQGIMGLYDFGPNGPTLKSQFSRAAGESQANQVIGSVMRGAKDRRSALEAGYQQLNNPATVRALGGMQNAIKFVEDQADQLHGKPSTEPRERTPAEKVAEAEAALGRKLTDREREEIVMSVTAGIKPSARETYSKPITGAEIRRGQPPGSPPLLDSANAPIDETQDNTQYVRRESDGVYEPLAPKTPAKTAKPFTGELGSVMDAKTIVAENEKARKEGKEQPYTDAQESGAQLFLKKEATQEQAREVGVKGKELDIDLKKARLDKLTADLGSKQAADAMLKAEGSYQPGQRSIANPNYDFAIENGAWQWLTTKSLPYLGMGSGGAATELRTRMLERAGELMRDRELSPEQLPKMWGNVTANTRELATITTRAGLVGTFETTVEGSAKIAQRLSDEYKRGDYRLTNRIINAWNTEVKGDAQANNLSAQLHLLANEWAKVSQGSTGAGGVAMTEAQATQRIFEALSNRSLDSLINNVVLPDARVRMASFNNQQAEINKRMSRAPYGQVDMTDITAAGAPVQPPPPQRDPNMAQPKQWKGGGGGTQAAPAGRGGQPQPQGGQKKLNLGDRPKDPDFN